MSPADCIPASAEITDLLPALPAASTACKTTARPEFAPPVPDAPGQLPSVQMTDSEQRLSSSLYHVAALFIENVSPDGILACNTELPKLY